MCANPTRCDKSLIVDEIKDFALSLIRNANIPCRVIMLFIRNCATVSAVESLVAAVSTYRVNESTQTNTYLLPLSDFGKLPRKSMKYFSAGLQAFGICIKPYGLPAGSLRVWQSMHD